MTRRLAPRPSSGGSKKPTVSSILPYSMTRTFSVQSVLVNTSDQDSFDIATDISKLLHNSLFGKAAEIR